MIRTLVITDCETTGLDPTKDACIEVAVALYDVATATLTESYASLIRADENQAEHINRIPVAALRDAPPPDYVWARVSELAASAHARGMSSFVAHRCEFDRSFFPKEIANCLRWTCSKFDIEWPKSKLGDHLVNVALAHGVPVHDNHRAMTDVMLIVKVLQSVQRSSRTTIARRRRRRRSSGTRRARSGATVARGFGRSRSRTQRSCRSRCGR